MQQESKDEKEIINEAAKRLAWIFCAQIEEQNISKDKKKTNGEKIEGSKG